MDKVINYLTGFFGGLMAVMMSILPVTILWYVLTGGDVWGMDVIIATSAKTDEEALALLKGFNFPFGN